MDPGQMQCKPIAVTHTQSTCCTFINQLRQKIGLVCVCSACAAATQDATLAISLVLRAA
jgi:hypothetical protein